MTGSHYLLLKNAERLSEKQATRLEERLAVNANLNAVYSLKEQLQQLWVQPGRITAMSGHLQAWGALAAATGLAHEVLCGDAGAAATTTTALPSD